MVEMKKDQSRCEMMVVHRQDLTFNHNVTEGAFEFWKKSDRPLKVSALKNLFEKQVM